MSISFDSEVIVEVGQELLTVLERSDEEAHCEVGADGFFEFQTLIHKRAVNNCHDRHLKPQAFVQEPRKPRSSASFPATIRHDMDRGCRTSLRMLMSDNSNRFPCLCFCRTHQRFGGQKVFEIVVESRRLCHRQRKDAEVLWVCQRNSRTEGQGASRAAGWCVRPQSRLAKQEGFELCRAWP